MCIAYPDFYFLFDDKWDEYYHGSNKLSEEILDETLREFFDGNPEYSEFYNQLKACGAG